MSEKKYTILMSCIACLLALVLALCSVTVSRAEEAETVDIDYLWYQAGDKCGTELSTSYNYDDWESATSKSALFPVLSSNLVKSNTCHFSYWGTGKNYTGTYSSDSEIVAFVDVGVSADKLDASGVYLTNNYKSNLESNLDYWKKALAGGLVSKSQMIYQFYTGTKSRSGVYEYGNLSSVIYSDSYTYAGNSFYLVESLRPYTSNYDFGFYSNVKLFDSYKSATEYLTSGDLSGLVVDGNVPKQTYSSELLLNDFDIQFHDSNKFEECYLDVKYTIPDSFKSVSTFQIDMEEQFDWIGTISGSVSDVTDSHTGTNYIDVLNHADGFRIYLKDIKAIDNFINKYDGAFDKALKRFVLGNLNYVNFPFSKYIIGTVKTSNLNIKFHLVAEKKYGHYVDYNLNLLSGVGVKNSYVPDTEGNYTSNNDTKVMGHYYADVGTDAAGNTTYNYYYYYSDGGKEKVSSEDAANNTITNTVQDGAIRIVNSPTFNNNITVEGDNIRNEANSYADSKSDSDTNKGFIDKFLGFFDIIENNSFLGVFAKVFAWLPVGVSTLITTALGIVVGVRVFKFFK